jgi:hypothetical protein
VADEFVTGPTAKHPKSQGEFFSGEKKARSNDDFTLESVRISRSGQRFNGSLEPKLEVSSNVEKSVGLLHADDALVEQ